MDVTNRMTTGDDEVPLDQGGAGTRWFHRCDRTLQRRRLTTCPPVSPSSTSLPLTQLVRRPTAGKRDIVCRPMTEVDAGTASEESKLCVTQAFPQIKPAADRRATRRGPPR